MSPSDPRRRSHERAEARLHRQFDRLRRALPWFNRWIAHLQSHHAALIRLPVALLLMVGGVFSFLPFLGLWMLPLGLMLLAIDVPALRGPVSAAVVRLRRRTKRWRRKIAARLRS